MADEFPAPGMEATLVLVVRDIDRARTFYRDVLGAEISREYAGTSIVLHFIGTWILLVAGGGPTPDKPNVTFTAPTEPNTVDHEITIRVPDCQAAYDKLRSRGAQFLTSPVQSDWEVRAFFRDPDGHLLEISEARSG